MVAFVYFFFRWIFTRCIFRNIFFLKNRRTIGIIGGKFGWHIEQNRVWRESFDKRRQIDKGLDGRSWLAQPLSGDVKISLNFSIKIISRSDHRYYLSGSSILRYQGGICSLIKLFVSLGAFQDYFFGNLLELPIQCGNYFKAGSSNKILSVFIIKIFLHGDYKMRRFNFSSGFFKDQLCLFSLIPIRFIYKTILLHSV